MHNDPPLTINAFGEAPFFIFCDHASNFIPPALNSLGLPEDLLQTHVAWDIGAASLAAALAEDLSGVSAACTFSRLVVDANREAEASDLIPAISDQLPIPGNQHLSEDDRQNRISQFHTPYHQRLGEEVDAFAAKHRLPFIISVHSFTDRLMGAAEKRPWKISLLWREDESSARAMIDYLSQETGWRIGDNEPYDARQFNYSIDRHVGPRGLPHLTFEVRQDILLNNDDIKRLSQLLSRGVRAVAAGQSEMHM